MYVFMVSQKSRTIYFFFMFHILLDMCEKLRIDTVEKLTMKERVKLVFMFGKDGATYRSVAEEFNRTHPEREKPLSHTPCLPFDQMFPRNRLSC